MNKVKPILILGLLFWITTSFLCCKDPKLYDLTEDELKSKIEIENDCHCEVLIEKDYEVVHQNKDEGELYISLTFNESNHNLCKEYDSVELANKGKTYFKIFADHMDQKEKYSSIILEFYSSDHPDSRTEVPNCSKEIIFSLKTNTIHSVNDNLDPGKVTTGKTSLNELFEIPDSVNVIDIDGMRIDFPVSSYFCFLKYKADQNEIQNYLLSKTNNLNQSGNYYLSDSTLVTKNFAYLEEYHPYF